MPLVPRRQLAIEGKKWPRGYQLMEGGRPPTVLPPAIPSLVWSVAYEEETIARWSRMAFKGIMSKDILDLCYG